MATKYKVATGLLIAGIVCFGLFYLIGSEVDENGYLNEPFYLLPIGFIFICLFNQEPERSLKTGAFSIIGLSNVFLYN